MELGTIIQVILFLAFLGAVGYGLYFFMSPSKSVISDTVEKIEVGTKTYALVSPDNLFSLKISHDALESPDKKFGRHRLMLISNKDNMERFSVNVPKEAKYIGGNNKGQIAIFDEDDKEVFSYPPTDSQPKFEDNKYFITFYKEGSVFLVHKKIAVPLIASGPMQPPPYTISLPLTKEFDLSTLYMPPPPPSGLPTTPPPPPPSGLPTTPPVIASTPSVTTTPTPTPTPVPTATPEPIYGKFSNTDYAGHDLAGGVAGSLELCKKSCDSTDGCNAFVIDKEEKNNCYLKALPADALGQYNSSWSTYYKGTPPAHGEAKEVKDYRLIDGNGNSVASKVAGNIFWWSTIPGADDQKWSLDTKTGLVRAGLNTSLCLSSVEPNPGNCDTANTNMIWKDDGTHLINGEAKWKHSQWSATS